MRSLPRYKCWFDPMRRAYVLGDFHGVGIFEEPPPEQQTLLDPDAVMAVLEAAKDDSWLGRLTETQFDKELTREHLKLMGKLVDKLPNAGA
jgi:hypothetical protein